jgi:hypothetical protein
MISNPEFGAEPGEPVPLNVLFTEYIPSDQVLVHTHPVDGPHDEIARIL